MEKEKMSEKPKYVMATILMPIEVRDLEEEDFVCLQERARVSLSFCRELPDVAGEGEGYGGLSDKIRALYDSFEKTGVDGDADVAGEERGEVGTGDMAVEKEGGIERMELESTKIPPKESHRKGAKRNITYRSFRENKKSHRYTFHQWR